MAKRKKFTSPSYLQSTPHGYYFRYKVPPDVRPAVGRTELKCSLRTGRLSEAKARSGMLSSLTHLAVSNIRCGGRMSELSPAEIQKLIKQRFEQALEEDETNRTNRKTLGEEEWMHKWSLNETFLSETKEDLAKSDYHDVSGAVEWLLSDNGLDVNKESENFKRLCREMLKVEVKILEIAKRRDLGDYEFEETVFPQAPTFSPEQDNRPTETIAEVIKHYVSESEANWTPKTKAEIVDGSLALLVETVGDESGIVRC